MSIIIYHTHLMVLSGVFLVAELVFPPTGTLVTSRTKTLADGFHAKLAKI